MKIKEPYSTVLYIVLGVLLAFGINQGLALALSTDLPIVAVESKSMLPTFDQGDVLFLQGQPSYEIGDIIVFTPTPGATPVVHRIIIINPDGTYQTKGDANRSQLPFEKEIHIEQIHGKVVLIAPYLGWVKIGITQYIVPNILALAGIVVFLYLMIIGIRKVWRS
ncbi:MAG: signal peptidase I [Candidatus Aenigmarchaeota archaeon]|nr:signal peptidase I [Candidatus Aenigmarchaeota archaeon]